MPRLELLLTGGLQRRSLACTCRRMAAHALGAGGSAPLGRRALQELILQAAARRDAEGILSLVRNHSESLGPVSVVTAVHRLAKLLGARPSLGRRALDELQKPLAVRVHDMRPQAVANSMWALATLHCEDAELLSRLSDAAVRQLERFQGRHLSNAAWALATLVRSSDSLVVALSVEVSKRARREFSPQGLSILLWSFAALRELELRVFDALGPGVLAAAADFNAQDIANTLWALTLHPERTALHGPLLPALASAARRRRSSLLPEDLTNIVWAFAEEYQGMPGARVGPGRPATAACRSFERVE
mmetsp:Transcript_116061/g.374953  ORF Transcript_116061/g.374953 Transcript_116061/m.374953 type:complete len:304 (-) Transcript_116061:9-920(-)